MDRAGSGALVTMSAKRRDPGGMTAEELRELVHEMSELALDLAQDLEYSARFSKRRHRRAALRRACEMAYRLYLYPHEGPRVKISGTRTAVFDSEGLRVDRPDERLPTRADKAPPARGTATDDAAAGS